MKNVILLILILMTSGIAFAEPIYLQCSITTQKNEKQVFSVRIDEANGKITHTFEGGTAYNLNGFFSINEISYQIVEIPSRGIKFTRQYKIDREKLSIKNVWTMESTEFPDKVPSVTKEENGMCSIITAKKKKI